MRFFVVRHGETAWNVEGRFQGQMDIPLNNKGIVQAERLAQRFIGHKFSAIISSPLSRAHVTAAKIAEVAVYDEFITDALLTEINHGDWEGCLADEIKKSWPDDFKTWHDTPEKVTMPGAYGESLQDVYRRSTDFAEKVAAKYTGDVLIASHDAVIKTLLCYWLDAPVSSFWRFQIANCSITAVEILKGKSPRLSLLGDASHLYQNFDRPEHKGL